MNRCRTECCALPLLAVALRYREAKRLLLLGVGFFFEPEGRGLWASTAGLSSPAKLARESLPACHFKLGHRVPEESRFELRSRGFDLGAQRRVESLPACQWNQGVRRFFEIAFLGLGRFGPSKASKFGERFEELFGVSYGAGWCHFAP